MPSETRAAAGGEGGRPSRLADEELMALVAAGDAGAFTALYDRHGRAAYSLAFRTTGERQAAEDLTQDSFLKVWRSAGVYKPELGSVRTWILTIVRNRGVDRLRSRATRRRIQDRVELSAARSEPSEAFREAWHAYRRGLVREALRDLPPEQREVLVLVHFCGLTQAEVSERLRLPLGTVKGRARLGLRKLRGNAGIRGMAPG